MTETQQIIQASIPPKREFLLKWLTHNDNEDGFFNNIKLADVTTLPGQIFMIAGTKYRVYSNIWGNYVPGLV